MFLAVSIRKIPFSSVLAALFLAVILVLQASAQGVGSIPYRSQEVSETDGLPVLLKHLPDFERVKDKAVFATNADQLRTALGERPIFRTIDFSGGTEAAAANYDGIELLIVEFATPQGSIDADSQINQFLDASPDASIVYRRIGNYNVLAFNAVDRSAGEALVDQVKYEKDIQWLGENPFRITAERAFIITTSDMFLSTLMVIVGGVVFSMLAGLVFGFVYFQLRERRRLKLDAYSDAGGMTRLNLDGFIPNNLLDD